MLSPGQEQYILTKAYVPEHITNLMVGISGGEPFLEDGYVFFLKDDWLIFVGYPLDRNFQPADFSAALSDTRKRFNPAYTWFIAPEVPEAFSSARQRESDEYYKLDILNRELGTNLARIAVKASRDLAVERSRHLSQEHGALTGEFLKRENPPPRVRELFGRMPEYVSYSETSLVLNARDKQNHLSSFYVLEMAAETFATYVVGGFSRKHYVAHASDLLFYEMIKLAGENHKEYIHLGLGVNEGVRRFKRKWGGIPFLKYEFGELSTYREGPSSWLEALGSRL